MTIIFPMGNKKYPILAEWSIESSENLGDVVHMLRKESGLTLRQAATLCGVNYRFFVELEHGKPTVRLSHVLKVLKALGIVISLRRQGLK